jgi:hypothetical protein
MADVNDRDFVAGDTVIDDVRVAPEPQGMDPKRRNQAVPGDRSAEIGNPPLDIGFHLVRRARVAAVDVFEDRLAVGERRGV